MRKTIVLLALLLAIIACKTESKDNTITTNVEAVKEEKPDTIVAEKSSVPSMTFSELEPIFNRKDDKVYVINFWATWCKPCIEELPYFETVNEKYKDQNVEVILVSLDLVQQVEKGLKRFIEKRDIQSKVIHLNDPDQNSWIPKIDPDWDGAIPATVIYNNNKKAFFAKSFTLEELENELKTYL